jgi:hypothetical protein
VATLLALWWANSAYAASYQALIHTQLGFFIGEFELKASLKHIINDGLMDTGLPWPISYIKSLTDTCSIDLNQNDLNQNDLNQNDLNQSNLNQSRPWLLI